MNANARRWVELAGALLLGVVIGHFVVPSGHYTVGYWRVGESGFLYRYDIHSGKTWRCPPLGGWKEITESDEVSKTK